MLVAHGITRQGERVVLHLSPGGRESTGSWKGVLNDLVERGLGRPQLLITDGNPGLLKAMRDVWPEVPRQRCAVHRIRNVLARVPMVKINASKLQSPTTRATSASNFLVKLRVLIIAMGVNVSLSSPRSNHSFPIFQQLPGPLRGNPGCFQIGFQGVKRGQLLGSPVSQSLPRFPRYLPGYG